MELTKQVCSLELAKKLKELGVKQESYFVWCEHSDGRHIIGVEQYSKEDKTLQLLSAFTVAELGSLLPWDMICWRNIDKEWVVQFQANGLSKKEVKSFGPDTEANVRASMLIYLLENKLISQGDGR